MHIRYCEYTCTYVIVRKRAPTLLVYITLIEVDGYDHYFAHQLSRTVYRFVVTPAVCTADKSLANFEHNYCYATHACVGP